MPKNNIFNFTNDIKEQNLISELKKEAIEIYGTNMYYIQRNSVDYNQILGEDLKQDFTDATLLVIYPENVENFGGNKEMFAKFGFDLQDTSNFLVHKDEIILTGKEFPEAGDLVYWKETKRLFKIDFVDIDAVDYYQLGKNCMYKMQCSLFKYSSENIDTNVEEIDAFKIFQNDNTINNDPSDVDNDILINKAPDWLVEE